MKKIWKTKMLKKKFGTQKFFEHTNNDFCWHTYIHTAPIIYKSSLSRWTESLSWFLPYCLLSTWALAFGCQQQSHDMEVLVCNKLKTRQRNKTLFSKQIGRTVGWPSGQINPVSVPAAPKSPHYRSSWCTAVQPWSKVGVVVERGQWIREDIGVWQPRIAAPICSLGSTFHHPSD